MQDSGSAPDLSINEGNALRYAAGYINRHVFKKIRKSEHCLKDGLTNCCQKLLKCDHDHGQSTAEEWTDLVDRGGLWHVHETTFQLLCALEEEVRTYLNALSSWNTSGLQSQFVKKLMKSENVLFYWCIATADFEVDDVEVHEQLLKMIIELFLTIRGFSYASAWMEHYKQALKKSTQRSKSLRKELYTDSNL